MIQHTALIQDPGSNKICITHSQNEDLTKGQYQALPDYPKTIEVGISGLITIYVYMLQKPDVLN